MAYDENLAQRVWGILAGTANMIEKKMFGGTGYMLNGNMACGILGESLIVRVGPDRYQEALSHAETRVFDMTGRPMTGWVVVSPQGLESEEALKAWVKAGLDFAATLPPK
jgi:hypothetical protein